MARVLTACSSMAAKFWLSADEMIEIKMSFNIQTGAVVAGYRQILPEYTGWRGWVGAWQRFLFVNGAPGFIVMLPGLPVLVLSLGMVRMSTTLIAQRQLADRDNNGGWALIEPLEMIVITRETLSQLIIIDESRLLNRV